ncbi:MAG: hypothetical protein LBP41_01500 [Holosporaceae bacterium]|jgi:hypothetical protein|nr:hypothetical protein [Holosporaceae bacterium]
MLSGEEKMWRAVIERAITDAFSNRTCKATKREIFDWFYGGGFDFDFVCDMADVSPANVRRKLLREKIRRQK